MKTKIFVFAVLPATLTAEDVSLYEAALFQVERSLGQRFEVVQRDGVTPLRELIAKADYCFTLGDYPFGGFGKEVVQLVRLLKRKSVALVSSNFYARWRSIFERPESVGLLEDTVVKVIDARGIDAGFAARLASFKIT